jgi:hypothetical protein
MSETVRSRPPLRARLPTTQSAFTVFAGDLFVLFVLIAVGQYTHDYLFWEAPVRTVLILTPFAFGWLLVFPLAGLFSAETLRSYRRTLSLLVPAWMAASLVGSALRETELFPGGAPLAFVLVNIGTGLLFFVPWRLFATWLHRRSAA